MAILRTLDFESGNLLGTFSNQNRPEAVRSNTSVLLGPGPPHPIRSGNWAMRAYLHKTKSQYSYRTMAQLAACIDCQKSPPWTGKLGQEYWIGISAYIDPTQGFVSNSWPDNVFQTKAEPWDCEGGHPFGVIYLDYPNWLIQHTILGSKSIPLGDAIGGWTDWVFNARFSKSSDGFYKVWHNGDLVYSRSGRNMPDCCNGFWKLSWGMYSWYWRPEFNYNTSWQWRLMYWDEFRLGDANSSYEEVSPSSKPPEPLDPEKVIVQEALNVRGAMRLPMPLSYKYPAVLREHGYSQGAGFGHKEINGRMWGWQIGFNLDGGSAVAYSPEDNYDATVFVKLP